MNHLTKQKISLFINDIYYKSKRNETFKAREICSYYHIGHQLPVILKQIGYIKKVKKGEFIYCHGIADNKTIDYLYGLYHQYSIGNWKNYVENNKPKNKEKDNKQVEKMITNNDRIDLLFNRYDDLNNKINKIEELIKEMENLLMRISCTFIKNEFDPKPKKSFISKLFS
jgi:hypothetical protein